MTVLLKGMGVSRNFSRFSAWHRLPSSLRWHFPHRRKKNASFLPGTSRPVVVVVSRDCANGGGGALCKYARRWKWEVHDIKRCDRAKATFAHDRYPSAFWCRSAREDRSFDTPSSSTDAFITRSPKPPRYLNIWILTEPYARTLTMNIIIKLLYIYKVVVESPHVFCENFTRKIIRVDT